MPTIGRRSSPIIRVRTAYSSAGGVRCSDLDEQDRFVYIKPADAARKVLIEDFTGQKCVNCPKATDEIHVLQETYGEDNIIAVGIHSGPLGFAGNKTIVGLLTYLGASPSALRVRRARLLANSRSGSSRMASRPCR